MIGFSKKVTRMTRLTGVAWITRMPGITGMLNRFESRSRLIGTKCRLNMTIQVIVLLNRTVVDHNKRFDKLCASHLQSQSELCHIS